MRTITLYKNNRIDGEYTVPIIRIIQDYNHNPTSKLPLPFERKFLIYMMDAYSGDTFELTEKNWENIYMYAQMFPAELAR